MEDWSGETPDKAPRPTLRPVFVAVLIVVACIALAVWTLQNLNKPEPPAPADAEATETAAPTTTPRKRTAAATAVPRIAAPASPTPSPTSASTALAATATPPPAVTAPPATPRPTPAVRVAHEPASLKTVAPPKVKRGGPTLLDVRGLGLRAEHHAIVLRDGRVPADIAVPRQKLVDSTLIQVLVIVSANAAKGDYDVAVMDRDGRRSNTVHFEVIP